MGERREYNALRGMKETRLYVHIQERVPKSGLDTLEKRVKEVYTSIVMNQNLELEPGFSWVWGHLVTWLGTEATVEDLLLEFNEHELMELLLPYEVREL